MNGWKNCESDEECEENVEALREASGEDVPIRDRLRHAAILLLLKGLIVHVVMVAEETLK